MFLLNESIVPLNSSNSKLCTAKLCLFIFMILFLQSFCETSKEEDLLFVFFFFHPHLNLLPAGSSSLSYSKVSHRSLSLTSYTQGLQTGNFSLKKILIFCFINIWNHLAHEQIYFVNLLGAANATFGECVSTLPTWLTPTFPTSPLQSSHSSIPQSS